MSHFDIESELLTLDFRGMYVRWGSNTPPRTGLHASDVLVKESDWCLRQHVLANLYPEAVERTEWNPWDWKKSAIFENGWDLHRRWQRVFRKCGNVVYTPVSPEWIEAHSKHFEIPLNLIDGQWCAPELDLTHYDEYRQLSFSPDAILWFGGVRYVIEIKGIKEQSYLELTDDLEQACAACETVYKAREQCNLYLQLLGLSRGILLIENKNTCDFKVWVIEHDEKRAHQYTNRMYDIKGRTALVQSQGLEKLPLRCCKTSGDTRARACPMRNVCFKQEESEDW